MANDRTAMNATQEIKIRIAPDQKESIVRAAEVQGIKVSQLVRDAAQRYADEILAEVRFSPATVVPPVNFDAMVESLDEPGQPNERIVAAAHRLAELDLD